MTLNRGRRCEDDRGMDRLRGQLAWEFPVPPLLAAYDKAFATGGT